MNHQLISLSIEDKALSGHHVCSICGANKLMVHKNINGFRLRKTWLNLMHEANHLELVVREQINRQKEIIESKCTN